MENQETQKPQEPKTASDFIISYQYLIGAYNNFLIPSINKYGYQKIINKVNEEYRTNKSVYLLIIDAMEKQQYDKNETNISEKVKNDYLKASSKQLEDALINHLKRFFIKNEHTSYINSDLNKSLCDLIILFEKIETNKEDYQNEIDLLCSPNYDSLCESINKINTCIRDEHFATSTDIIELRKEVLSVFEQLKRLPYIIKRFDLLNTVTDDKQIAEKIKKTIIGDLERKKKEISDDLDKKYDKLSLAIRKQTDMFHYLADGKDSFGKAIQETDKDNLKKSNQLSTWLFVDTHFKNKSQKWLVASMLLAIVPILLLFVWKPASITDFFHVTLPQTASTHVLYLSWLIQVSKRVFFIVLYVYVLQVCIKNYNANRHNQIANKHRANVLETLLLLIDKDKFAEQKESIEKMVVSIVEQKNTGFEKQDVAVLSDLLAVLGKLKQ